MCLFVGLHGEKLLRNRLPSTWPASISRSSLATRIDCCFPVFPTTKDAPFGRAPQSGIHIYAGLVVLVIVSFRARFERLV